MSKTHIHAIDLRLEVASDAAEPEKIDAFEIMGAVEDLLDAGAQRPSSLSERARPAPAGVGAATTPPGDEAEASQDPNAEEVLHEVRVSQRVHYTARVTARSEAEARRKMREIIDEEGDLEIAVEVDSGPWRVDPV